MELKDRIAAVRKAAGLTQEQLGELLGSPGRPSASGRAARPRRTPPPSPPCAKSSMCRRTMCCWERSRGGTECRARLRAAGHLPLLRAEGLRQHLPGVRLSCAQLSAAGRPVCRHGHPARLCAECGAVGAAGEILRLHPGRSRQCHRPLCERPVPHPAAAGLDDGAAQYIAAHLDQDFLTR